MSSSCNKKETTLLPRMIIIYGYTDMSSCFHNLIPFLFEKSIYKDSSNRKKETFSLQVQFIHDTQKKAHVHIHKKKVNLNKCKHTHHKNVNERKSSYCKTLRFIKKRRKKICLRKFNSYIH